MRKKFKIYYDSGELYKPKNNSMVIMNSQGIFFLWEYNEGYYPSCRPLVNVIGNYDVVWNK